MYLIILLALKNKNKVDGLSIKKYKFNLILVLHI